MNNETKEHLVLPSPPLLLLLKDTEEEEEDKRSHSLGRAYIHEVNTEKRLIKIEAKDNRDDDDQGDDRLVKRGTSGYGSFIAMEKGTSERRKTKELL
uniref:Uncharacterized protein n=1 Tax=Caenorhabditis tropicalis TaxID=1561998 RepID=A0A1I7UAA9_9PELO